MSPGVRDHALTVVALFGEVLWGRRIKDALYVFLTQNGAQQLSCDHGGRHPQGRQDGVGGIHYTAGRDSDEEKAIA